MNEITKVPANDDDTPLAGSLLNFVARAMADPAIDVTKLEMLLRMQREIVAEDARVQFHRAMNATQGEMQAVVRDAINDQTRSKYATLEAVDAAIRPVYARNGFSLSFSEVPNDAPELRIACLVKHAAGHVETYHLSALSDTVGAKGNPNKTPIQGVGSSVSYLRRYLTCMIFNVALRDDNDGNRQRPANDRGPNQDGDTGELISRVQVNELRALMLETRILEAVVLAKKAPGLATIEALPAAAFHVIRNDLLSRKNVLAQRAAANSQTRNGVAA